MKIVRTFVLATLLQHVTFQVSFGSMGGQTNGQQIQQPGLVYYPSSLQQPAPQVVQGPTIMQTQQPSEQSCQQFILPIQQQRQTCINNQSQLQTQITQLQAQSGQLNQDYQNLQNNYQQCMNKSQQSSNGSQISIQNLQAQLQALQNENKFLNQNNLNLKNELASLKSTSEANYLNYEDKINEQIASINNLNLKLSQMGNLQVQLSNCKNQVSLLDKQQKDFSSEFSAVKNDLGSCQLKSQQLQAQVSQVEEYKQRVQNLNLDLEEQKKSSEENGKCKTQVLEMTSQLADLNLWVSKKDDKITELTNSLTQCNIQIKNSQADSQNHFQNMTSKAQQIEQITLQLSKCQEQLKSMDEQINKLNPEFEAFKLKSISQEKQISSQLSECEKNNLVWQTQFNQIQDANKSLEEISVQCNTLKADYSNLKVSEDNLKKNLAVQQVEYTKLQGSFTDLQKQISEKEASCQKSAQEWQNKIDQCNSSLFQTEKRVQNIQVNLQEREKETQISFDNFNTCQQNTAELNKQIQNFTQQLEVCGKNNQTILDLQVQLNQSALASQKLEEFKKKFTQCETQIVDLNKTISSSEQSQLQSKQKCDQDIAAVNNQLKKVEEQNQLNLVFQDQYNQCQTNLKNTEQRVASMEQILVNKNDLDKNLKKLSEENAKTTKQLQLCQENTNLQMQDINQLRADVDRLTKSQALVKESSINDSNNNVINQKLESLYQNCEKQLKETQSRMQNGDQEREAQISNLVQENTQLKKMFQNNVQQLNDLEKTVQRTNNLLNNCQLEKNQVLTQVQDIQKENLRITNQRNQEQSDFKLQIGNMLKNSEGVKLQIDQLNQKNSQAEKNLTQANDQLNELKGVQVELQQRRDQVAQFEKDIGLMKKEVEKCSAEKDAMTKVDLKKVQACESEKNELKMSVLSFKQEIRNMSFNIHNDYSGANFGLDDSNGLLEKCRSDLNRLTVLWNGQSFNANSIKNPDTNLIANTNAITNANTNIKTNANTNFMPNGNKNINAIENLKNDSSRLNQQNTQGAQRMQLLEKELLSKRANNFAQNKLTSNQQDLKTQTLNMSSEKIDWEKGIISMLRGSNFDQQNMMNNDDGSYLLIGDKKKQ